MANYNDIKNYLQSKIFDNPTNLITGDYLCEVLARMVDSLGVDSNFMGLLTNSNKPTEAVDGKQFYIGINTGTTAVSIDLTAVGCGTISLTQSKIYLVYTIGSGWNAIDIGEGISNTIPHNVSELNDAANYAQKQNKIELRGEVRLERVYHNTVYYLTDVKDLRIADYGYDITGIEAYREFPTYMVVSVDDSLSDPFDVSLPGGSKTLYGSSWTLQAGITYLITVVGNLWNIEQYRDI